MFSGLTEVTGTRHMINTNLIAFLTLTPLKDAGNVSVCVHFAGNDEQTFILSPAIWEEFKQSLLVESRRAAAAGGGLHH
jgi:hypothetical protein